MDNLLLLLEKCCGKCYINKQYMCLFFANYTGGAMQKNYLFWAFFLLPLFLGAGVQVGKWHILFGSAEKITCEQVRAVSATGKLPAGAVEFKFHGNSRNLRDLRGGREFKNPAALLHTTITSREKRKLNIGIGCDWYMSVFCNGKTVMSNEPRGSQKYTTHTPLDYQLTLELEAGVNHLVFRVRPGLASWMFAFSLAPSPEFWPESSDGRKAFFRRLFPEKARTFNIFPYLSDVRQTSARLSMEFADEEAAGIRFRPAGSKEWRTIAPERRAGLISRKKLHHFQLNALEPATRYECVVFLMAQDAGKEPVPLQQLSFTTLPERGLEHKMLFISDTQVLPPICIDGVGAAVKFTPDAAMFVHLGDIQSFINAPLQDFFRNVVDVVNRDYPAKLKSDPAAALMPVLMVRGNHDFRGKYAEKFADYFPASYRAFRLGEVFYIVLDTGEHLPTSYRRNSITYFNDFTDYFQQQREWLKGVIASPECRSAKRRIVLSHATPFSYESHFRRSIEFITDNVFFGKNPRCRIDLWIAGHIHTAFRTHPEEKVIYGRADNYLKRFKAKHFKGVDFPVYINDGPGGKVSLSSLELIHDAAGMEIICRELPSGKVLDHVRLEKGKNFSVKKTTFIKY